MSLELFSKKGGRYSKATISITASGQIGISSGCLEKYFKGCDYVLLYGDMDKGTIGIKPIQEPKDNSFKISYSVNKKNGSISGHSFLNYIGIDYKTKTKTYSPIWDDKLKLLVIETK